jgi:hypothetical protein
LRRCGVAQGDETETLAATIQADWQVNAIDIGDAGILENLGDVFACAFVGQIADVKRALFLALPIA